MFYVLEHSFEKLVLPPSPIKFDNIIHIQLIIQFFYIRWLKQRTHILWCFVNFTNETYYCYTLSLKLLPGNFEGQILRIFQLLFDTLWTQMMNYCGKVPQSVSQFVIVAINSRKNKCLTSKILFFFVVFCFKTSWIRPKIIH